MQTNGTTPTARAATDAKINAYTATLAAARAKLLPTALQALADKINQDNPDAALRHSRSAARAAADELANLGIGTNIRVVFFPDSRARVHATASDGTAYTLLIDRASTNRAYAEIE